MTNPKALNKNLKKLKRAGRAVSRKPQGSQNRKKAVKKLACVHARIANIRSDAFHQATSQFTHAELSPAERAALKKQLASTMPEAKTKQEQKVRRKQVKKLLHQTTVANAVTRPRVVVLEDLNVDAMKRNRKLARAISDVGMGEFRRLLGVIRGEEVEVVSERLQATAHSTLNDFFNHCTPPFCMCKEQSSLQACI